MADEPRELSFIVRWRRAVMNSGLSSSEKLVLVALAEFADADGSNCLPGIALVSRLASFNERTCRRVLDGLEGTWFTRHERKSKGHGWRHYVYHPVLPEGADFRPARHVERAVTEPAPSNETSGPSALTSGATSGLSRHNVRTLTTERAGTESTDLAHDLAHRPRKKQSLAPSRFDEFWTLYPRKDAKAKAESVWSKKRLDQHADAIIADVAARVADPGHWSDPQFIPYATTYLNQQRWKDEWARSLAPAPTIGRLPREMNADAINAASMRRLGLKP